MSQGFVRPATSEDAPRMAEVALASWPQAGDAIDQQELTSHWHALLTSSDSSAALVATEADAVVGWLLLLPDSNGAESNGPVPRWEIADVVVHPAHRRRGHGSRLMNAAVDLCMTAGGVLTAWCPLDDETRRAFLAAHGLAPDGAWRDLAADSGATMREVRMTAAVESHAAASDEAK